MLRCTGTLSPIGICILRLSSPTLFRIGKLRITFPSRASLTAIRNQVVTLDKVTMLRFQRYTVAKGCNFFRERCRATRTRWQFFTNFKFPQFDDIGIAIILIKYGLIWIWFREIYRKMYFYIYLLLYQKLVYTNSTIKYYYTKYVIIFMWTLYL